MDQIFTMLIKSATIVVLVSSELRMATGSMSLAIAPVSVFGAPIRYLDIQFKTPVWFRPAMTAKSAAMTRTEDELNPPKAPLISTTPLTNKADMAAQKMTSVRKFEKIIAANSAMMTAMVNHAFPERPNHSNASNPCNIFSLLREKCTIKMVKWRGLFYFNLE